MQRGESRTVVSAREDKAAERQKRERGGGGVSVRAYIINVIRISNMMSLFKFNGMLFNEHQDSSKSRCSSTDEQRVKNQLFRKKKRIFVIDMIKNARTVLMGIDRGNIASIMFAGNNAGRRLFHEIHTHTHTLALMRMGLVEHARDSVE